MAFLPQPVVLESWETNLIYTIVMAAADFCVGIIFVYILMSWIPNMGGVLRDFYEVLGRLCDPYLDLFRRIIPPVGGSGFGIDFSPIIAVIVLQVVARFLGQFLWYLP